MSEKIGKEIGEKAGRDLDALLGTGADKGQKNQEANLGVGTEEKKTVVAQEVSAVVPEAVKNGEVKEIGKDTGVEEEKIVEAPGASEKTPIELTKVEVVKEPKREIKESEVEVALTKAREEYVAALSENSKRKEGANQLQIIRDKFVHYFQGDKEEEYKRRKEEKIGGVMAEKAEAEERFLKAQENLKAAIKAYRDEEIDKIYKKASGLKATGKTNEEIKNEMEKSAKEILLATTLREATKIDSLKSDKQIEQMGSARRFINEKAEEFADWYKGLPMKTKIVVSVGLGIGGAVGALTGLTSVVSFALAGQVGLRVLGSAMTTGGLGKAMESSREKLAEKKMSKEFTGKYLEMLKNQNDELDDKIFERLGARKNEKVGRFILAGTMGALVGGGALAQVVRNGFQTEFGQEMTGKLRDVAGKTIDWVRHPFSGDSEIPVSGGAVAPETLPAAGGAKAGAEIMNLKIGGRGPEGAIIDNFKANPKLAESFGYDPKSGVSLDKWAGTKAHQLWLASLESELAKPGMAEKLTSQGFSADAEGYAKAMHKIGQEFFVELDPQGHMHLSDNISFLKAGAGNIEVVPDVPSPPEAPAPEVLGSEEKPSLGAEDLVNQKIKATVTRLVEPEILTDKTFKAAAKVSLGKILAEVPPGAYEDKYALSRYWHSLSGPGVHTPDLPGSGWLGLTYDDFRKYSEMAKFLRKNIGIEEIKGLKNMTVEEFFKIYGGDLNKVIKK